MEVVWERRGGYHEKANENARGGHNPRISKVQTLTIEDFSFPENFGIVVLQVMSGAPS